MDWALQGRDWRNTDVVAAALKDPAFLDRLLAINGDRLNPTTQMERTLMEEGMQHFQFHQYEEAAQAFTVVLRLVPANADIQVGLGHALTAQGNWQEGIVHYREAVRLRPTRAFYYLVLANAEWEHHDRQAALGTLQTGLACATQEKPLIAQWMNQFKNAHAQP